MRILVIRRDNIGDLVCTTPLFAALRARYPQAHIAALVNSYNAAVLDGNTDVNEVYSYTKLKHRLAGQSRIRIVADRLRMLAKLRRHTFDYIVLAKAGFDRQGLSLARQLRRRDVLGFVGPDRSPAAITRPVPAVDFDAGHEVETLARLVQPLDVADALGPLRVYPDRELAARWSARVPALAEPNRLRIAVHVSAREPGRVWPAERWTELIDAIARDPASRIVLLWSPGSADDPRHPGDDAKAATISKACRAIPVGTESLADLIAILSLCHAFIGADGGAMHLAAGLGLPMVALFENLESKKRRWYPWRVAHELVSPDTRDVADIAVRQVLDAWQRVRSGGPASRSADLALR